MLKAEVCHGSKGRVVVMDSITKLTPDDEGAIVVSASHGGASSGEFALAVPVGAVFFNDAGFGKENAGAVALAMLDERGIAAGVIAHTSARIGDSRDTWDNGVISDVNQAARKLGLRPGTRLQTVLSELVAPERRTN
ncbi:MULTISPECIES: hypothetical protein [unclassified Stappia]|uniref:hypothetical protein n=1 Tax=unclassified Stappia TaxID=2629676 RepID=UPI001643B713|nr:MULTISPECIES: hypothetical protein [unclassified Stappia]